MKKHLMAALFACAFILPATASAQNFASRPYVGVDVTRYNLDYGSENLGGGVVLNGNRAFDKGFNGFNVHVGNRFHENFALELGYFRTETGTRNPNIDISAATGTAGDGINATKVRLQGLSLDGLGYMPVAERVDLIGTAGLTWTRASYNVAGRFGGVNSGVSDSDSELSFRLGGGAQYNVTDSLALRTLVRWQHADFDNAVDNIWTYGIGLNVGF